MNKLLLLGFLLPLQLITTEAFAQTKGITFQGVLKRPDGTLPTVPGLTVNLKVLTPNGCVLRDEDVSGVNIANGYINLVIGKGTTNGSDPGKTIQAILNNTTAITGLNCLDSNNNVVSAGQTYTPTSIDARKLRLSLTLDGNPVIMDFNMRAIPFAVNSETLNGKLDTAFVNTNTPQGVTQTNLESVFARFTKLDSILNNFDGTGAVLTGNATNVTGTVAIANGGTGATTAAGARTNLGLGPLATMVPTGTADNTTYLRGDGTWATGSGGAVTSVAGRTGVVTLASTDITDFNAASDTRADGRITAQKGVASGLASLEGSGKVPSSQLALVAGDIPNLDAAKITSGTITQNVSATSVAGTTGSFTNLRIYDGTANFLTQTSPAAGFTANYTVQWPAAIGTSGQALQISSVAGAVATLGWVSPTANAVTGTGTTNTLPKFTAASTLGDSLISETGAAVTINGRLLLPATTTTAGQVVINGSRFMHNYAGTFLGADAGNFTSTGGLNTGIGSSALGLNTSGSNNTATGIAALRDNTTGSKNSVLGDLALSNNTTGDDNTALGHLAGTTSAGANANVTGSQNTYIGSNAGPASAVQMNNSTAIGYNAAVSASNSMVLGNSLVKVGIGSVTAPTSTLDFVGDLNMGQMAAPAVSAANNGRIYFDSTSKTFKVSQNNGAYVDLVGSGGTVSSVGLALPAEITVSNSPVTTTGSLTGAWANQTTNKVFASPNGSTGTPTFRALVNADLPVIDIAHGGTGLAVGTSGGIPYFDATTTMASSAALTANGVILGGGAGASPTATAAGAAYQPLRVPAGGGAPAFGAIDLSQSAAVTGTLAVANGGTGVTSFSNYSVVASNGSGAVISVPGTTAGSILQYSVTGPVWTTATFPLSTTANQLLYSSATNVVGGLATANNSILKTDGSGVPSWGALSSDVFTQYAILAGRAGGQTINGGTVASENLTLDSTAHATKGYVLLNPTGGNVGIGTATPGSKLEVNGDALINGLTVGRGGGSISSNTGLGSAALGANTTGANNTAIGQNALAANQTFWSNVAIGKDAMLISTGAEESVAIGVEALKSATSGDMNTIVGFNSGYNLSTGSGNTALGWSSLPGTGGGNIAIGSSAGATGTGSSNITIGQSAGANITSGSSNIMIGNNVAAASATGSSQLNIGDTIYGDLATAKIGIGIAAPNTALDVNGALSVRGMAAPAVSVAGQGRIYFDSTSNTFKVSQHNGAYVDLVGGSGTVTSVGLALPAEITVSNSPVTTTGSLTGAWANQTTNKVFASPNGSTGTPTFRALVNADLPVIDIAHGGTGLTVGTSGGIPYFDATTTMASSAALTANGVVLGGGAGASPTATAAGAAYQPLRVPAGGGAPAFGAIDLSQGAAVTGTLAVANGGTGVTSFSNYSVVASNGSGAVISVPGTAAGSLMQYSVTGPVWTTAVFPTSTTANQLLYSSATNVVGGLATANSSILKTDGSGVPSWGAISSDVFTQYAILAGRAGGQTLNGGTTASENLTLDSTAHATKGYVLLNPTGGNVGIGTTTPGSKLVVNSTSTATTGTIRGSSSYLEIDPSANSSGVYISNDTESWVKSGNTRNVSTVISSDNYAEHYGTGTVSSLTSGSFKTYSGAGSPVSTARGIYAESKSLGSTGDLGAGEFYTESRGTGTTSAYGVKSYTYGHSGSVVDMYGVFSEINTDATTTNAYGVYSKVRGGGTTTNGYGVYIYDVGGATNAYGVYQAGANDLNYFAGNVGIGTTSPASLFHVATSTTATGITTLEQASATADSYDIKFKKARGTVAAPTAITTADELGTIQFNGYSGAGGYVTGAAIKSISEGTIATTRVPANLSFWTGTDAAPTVLTERMRIDKAGNVGIGTTSPNWLLDVQGTSALGQFKRMSGTAGQPPGFLFTRTRGTPGSEADIVAGDQLGKVQFRARTGAAEVDYGGLVYVADSTTAGQGHFGFTKADLTTEVFSIFSNTGNVGIGVTAPGARLDVTDASTTTSAIIVPRAGNFTGTTVNGMIRYNTTSTLFEFYQNGIWVNYTTVSDGRLKTNVVPVRQGLDIVNQLNPVFYDWDQNNPKSQSFGSKHQVGFIAQEVEKVLPEVVNTGEDSYRSLEYGKIVSVVVAAVKELYNKVLSIEVNDANQDRAIASKADKSEINQLKVENNKLKEENLAIKAYLCAKDPQAAICR